MDTVFLALRVIVSLAVVLGVLWYLQKKLSKRGVGRAAGKAVTLIGRQAVGPKSSVAVVEVDGKRLVLGVTEHSVTVLSATELPAHPFQTTLADAQSPAVVPTVLPPNVRPITAPIPIRAVITTPEAMPAPAQELRRPRNRPQQKSRIAGSILSPETWRQASAAIREVR